MKSTILTLAVLAVAALAAAPGGAATIDQRQHRQQRRIAGGLVSGDLTAREAVRLGRWLASIARQEARMRARGSGLNPRERAVLHARLDRASAAIVRQRHDGDRRR